MSKMQTIDENKNQLKELSLKEQEAVISEEIQRFIALAKQKGELTIEEINESLPAEIVAPEALDAFMQALDLNGVKISEVSGNKDTDGEESSEFLADPRSGDDDEEEEEVSSEDVK